MGTVTTTSKSHVVEGGGLSTWADIIIFVSVGLFRTFNQFLHYCNFLIIVYTTKIYVIYNCHLESNARDSESNKSPN